jgi:hypothetical protein
MPLISFLALIYHLSRNPSARKHLHLEFLLGITNHLALVYLHTPPNFETIFSFPRCHNCICSWTYVPIARFFLLLVAAVNANDFFVPSTVSLTSEKNTLVPECLITSKRQRNARNFKCQFTDNPMTSTFFQFFQIRTKVNTSVSYIIVSTLFFQIFAMCCLQATGPTYLKYR